MPDSITQRITQTSCTVCEAYRWMPTFNNKHRGRVSRHQRRLKLRCQGGVGNRSVFLTKDWKAAFTLTRVQVTTGIRVPVIVNTNLHVF